MVQTQQGHVNANNLFRRNIKAAAATTTAAGLLDYGSKGDVEGRIACAFAAEAVADVASRIFGREALWGVEAGA
ncbi:MAG: hypothetical protein H0T51_11555, partial [Pirellulales bacterium]|nr:hypothetical protein [Pirellulales bacterium]